MEADQGKVLTDEKYEAFVLWLAQNNFPSTKLTLADFKSTGRGMMATSDIEVGEIIVSVPKAFVISNESLTKLYGTELFGAHQLLTIHLILLSREQNSWWTPYLNLLPKHFNTMPVNFPVSLVNMLPISLAEAVSLQKEKIRSDYSAAIHFIQSRSNNLPLSFEEYQRAWLCVNTRCIYLSSKEERVKAGNIGLTPMLDFLNHSWNAKIDTGYNAKTQSFELRALTRHRKGEQVFINYGPHDNFAILKEYGFVVPNNEFNYVEVDKEVWDLYDELDTKQSVIVKKKHLKETGYYGDYYIRNGEPSFRLLNALRLLALDGPHIARFEHRLLEFMDVVLGKAEHISDDNERRASIILQYICERVKKTAEERIAALKDLSALQATEQKEKIHPFALTFVKQIWQETIDIVSSLDITTTLS